MSYKKKIALIIFIVLFGVYSFWVYAFFYNYDIYEALTESNFYEKSYRWLFFNSSNINYEPKLINFSESEKNSLTIVTPFLDTKIDKNKNLIYCSSLQISWIDLINNLIKDPIGIENPPEYLSRLNFSKAQKFITSDDSFLSIVGQASKAYKKDIFINKNHSFEKLLSNITSENNIEAENIHIVSLMLKQVEFNNEFEGICGHEFKFSDKTIHVKAFGIKDYSIEQRQRVYGNVYTYHDTSESHIRPVKFAIKLRTLSKSDEVILSNFIPEETLEKTYKNIEFLVNNKYRYNPFFANSYITIPAIDFDVMCNYDKLTNKKLTNEKYKNRILEKVIQRIRFKLNGYGTFSLSYNNWGIVSRPQHYIINGPFFIYIKNKNSDMPYFMAYIANDELLEKE